MNQESMNDLAAMAGLLRASEELDKLQRRLERMNILDVLGIAKYELAHSSFWAWLFDPLGTHNMGDRFLRAFLRTCTRTQPGTGARAPGWRTPEFIDLESADLRRAKVLTEFHPTWMAGKNTDGDSIAKRRFDVFIELPLQDGERRAMVVVEFKIKSREGEAQTEDYAFAINAAINDDDTEYTEALAVFVDYKSRTPEHPGFIPIKLADLIASVIDPVVQASADIMHPDVAHLLKHYRLAITEESDEDVSKLREYASEHLVALAGLQDYLRWTPELADLVNGGMLPMGSVIEFRAKKSQPSGVRGTIQVRDGRPPVILVQKDGLPQVECSSLSTAAQVADGSKRSFNGWVHWYLDSKSLAALRADFRPSLTEVGRYCEAVLNGRRRAVEYLIALAREEELLACRPSRARTGGRPPTPLTDMVARGVLTLGMSLFSKQKEQQTCVVEKDGDQVVLRVGTAACKSPSAASTLMYGRNSNGFQELYFKDDNGSLHPLDKLRERYNAIIASEAIRADAG